MTRVRDIDLTDADHFILRPDYREQQAEVYNAMETAWQQGGWTIYIDEMYYVEKLLKLSDSVVKLLTQGRTVNVTVMVGMQRPAWVTRFALSEPTHVFCGRLGDERDATVIKQVIGDEYLQAVKTVPWHKFVYLDKVANRQIVIDKYSLAKVLKE